MSVLTSEDIHAIADAVMARWAAPMGQVRLIAPDYRMWSGQAYVPADWPAWVADVRTDRGQMQGQGRTPGEALERLGQLLTSYQWRTMLNDTLTHQ